MDDDNIVVSLFMEYFKTFDTAEYAILIAKLNNIGFRDTCNRLLSSYVHGRVQYVVIKDSVKLKVVY